MSQEVVLSVPKSRGAKKYIEYYLDFYQSSKRSKSKPFLWCSYPAISIFVNELESLSAIIVKSPFPTNVETVDVRCSESSRKLLNQWFSKHPVYLPLDELAEILVDCKQRCKSPGGSSIEHTTSFSKRRISLAHFVKVSGVGSTSLMNNLKSKTKLTASPCVSRSSSDEESELIKFSSRLVLGCEAAEDESSKDQGTPTTNSYPKLARQSQIRELVPSKTPRSETSEVMFTERAMQFIQESVSCEKAVQNVLTLILNYAQGTEIYLVRSTKSKMLVVDGAVGNGKVWSTLQSVPISHVQLFSQQILKEAKATRKPIHLVTSNQVIDKGGDYYIHNSPESLLCLPIFMQRKFQGALYLTNTAVSYAFQSVKTSHVILVGFSLLAMVQAKMSNQVKNRRSVSLGGGLNSVQRPLGKKEKALLQDSIYVYDPDTGQWNLMFVALTDIELCIYSTPFDTHPIRTLVIDEIEDIQVSSKQLKQKNIRFDVWPVLPLKFKAKNSLIYIQTAGDAHTWLALESIKILHNWYEILNQCRVNKTQIKQITLQDIPVNIRIQPEEISVGDVIGNGGAATVYRGTWNANTVAVKRLHDTVDQKEIKEFFDEVKILHTLRHPCIVTLMGGFVNEEGRPSIVFEYAHRGSLNDVLYDPLSNISYAVKLEFMKQICQALHYLHSFDPPIIHRDLKPANILITENWGVKLADFGLARICNSTLTLAQGTVKWMSPEILGNKTYSIKADIYSLALVMWEIIEQTPFFQEFRFNSQIEIQVVNHNARPPFSEKFSPVFREIISKCWDADPYNRPSAEELLEELSHCKSSDLHPVSLE